MKNQSLRKPCVIFSVILLIVCFPLGTLPVKAQLSVSGGATSPNVVEKYMTVSSSTIYGQIIIKDNTVHTTCYITQVNSEYEYDVGDSCTFKPALSSDFIKFVEWNFTLANGSFVTSKSDSYTTTMHSQTSLTAVFIVSNKPFTQNSPSFEIDYIYILAIIIIAVAVVLLVFRGRSSSKRLK
jgi:hypothetical protein